MSESAGLYIVIEGQDGTGKTTQVTKLTDYFAKLGRETLVINEGAEDDSGLSATDAIGKIIHKKDFALSPETNVLLFTAQRKELWDKKIAPTLSRNGVVIASRNWWSTLAYQHFGEGISRELITKITREFLPERYITPDRKVILLLDNDERARRMKNRSANVANDTFDSRESDFLTKVNRGYQQIARELKIPSVDASGTENEVFAKIKTTLEL